MESTRKCKGTWDYWADKNLIDQIKMFPGLYKRDNQEIYSKSKKDHLWRYIAGRCQRTDVECKIRWASLRAQYRKSVNMRMDNLMFHRKWRLHDEMAFLNLSFKSKKARNNSYNEEYMATSSNITQNENQSTSNKIRNDDLNHGNVTGENQDQSTDSIIPFQESSSEGTTGPLPQDPLQ